MLFLPDGLADQQVVSEIQEVVALQRPRPLTPPHLFHHTWKGGYDSQETVKSVAMCWVFVQQDTYLKLHTADCKKYAVVLTIKVAT